MGAQWHPALPGFFVSIPSIPLGALHWCASALWNTSPRNCNQLELSGEGRWGCLLLDVLFASFVADLASLGWHTARSFRVQTGMLGNIPGASEGTRGRLVCFDLCFALLDLKKAVLCFEKAVLPGSIAFSLLACDEGLIMKFTFELVEKEHEAINSKQCKIVHANHWKIFRHDFSLKFPQCSLIKVTFVPDV